MTDTFLAVKEIIAVHTDNIGVDREKITSSAILTSLGLDSIDRVEIVMSCEDKFSIEISDHDADTIETVQQLVEHIDSLLAKAAA